jgi:carbon storage regulator
MLILGRKKGESIHIGNDITISIEDISHGMVKVGIDAPKDIVILRSELKDKIAKENQKAIQKIDKDSLKDISKLLKK